MTRHMLSLVAIGLVSAAVGAQGPKSLRPEQRGELFKKNREVIETVVAYTVDSSRSPNDPLKRANTYYPVLLNFSQQISKANAADDRGRVDELTQHLTTLLDKGLAETLKSAKRVVEGGTGVDEFRKVKVDLIAELDALLDVLSNDPKAKKSLDGAKSNLNGIVIPEPR